MLLIGTACGALACAAEPERRSRSGPSPTVAPTAPPLCDGSDEVRWAQFVGLGGGHTYEPPFMVEYGGQHISIDGRCEFSLYDASLRGLRRGVIDAALADTLERELHFGSYGRFAEYPAPACVDSAGAWISDGTASVNTDCFTAPASVASAFYETMLRIEVLALELDAIAERMWRPVQILPLSEPSLLPAQPIYDWNAPFDLAARAVSAVAYSNGELNAAGIPVEDVATLARLDELRAIDIAADDDATARGTRRSLERGLFVRDTNGSVFQVLVRDEPSEAVRQAWGALAPF